MHKSTHCIGAPGPLILSPWRVCNARIRTVAIWGSCLLLTNILGQVSSEPLHASNVPLTQWALLCTRYSKWGKIKYTKTGFPFFNLKSCFHKTLLFSLKFLCGRHSHLALLNTPAGESVYCVSGTFEAQERF